MKRVCVRALFMVAIVTALGAPPTAFAQDGDGAARDHNA